MKNIRENVIYALNMQEHNAETHINLKLNVKPKDVKFSQDFTHQKSLKSVNFWQIY